MTASTSEQTGNQGMQGISLQHTILRLKDFTHKYGLDYGDWYILENSTSAFARTNRQSPFGFELSELPKEINNIGVLHIYNLNLYPFSVEKLLEYIADRI